MGQWCSHDVTPTMLQEIGLLDESMRFICSDSDLSFTARARGWQIICVPAAKCFHSVGSAYKLGATALRKVMATDMQRFCDKWVSGELFRSLEYNGMSRSISEIVATRATLLTDGDTQ